MQNNIFVLPLQSQSANGALVQLVRIRACHARGQGFESPTHRRREDLTGLLFFFVRRELVQRVAPPQTCRRCCRSSHNLQKLYNNAKRPLLKWSSYSWSSNLLRCHEEQIETLHSRLVRYDRVVRHHDRVGQLGILLVERTTI